MYKISLKTYYMVTCDESLDIGLHTGYFSVWVTDMVLN